MAFGRTETKEQSLDEFYHEQDRIRKEESEKQNKLHLEKLKQQESAQAIKLEHDRATTLQNWKECVARAAKEGKGVDTVWCSNGRVSPRLEVLQSDQVEVQTVYNSVEYFMCVKDRTVRPEDTPN